MNVEAMVEKEGPLNPTGSKKEQNLIKLNFEPG